MYKQQLSSTTPDWTREKKAFFAWDPSRSLLASIRSYQAASQSQFIFAFLVKKIAVLRHTFWSVITNAEIPINTQIGGGLLIPHPSGIVIHADAIIGVNCLIFQQVTLGTKDDSKPPILAGRVDVGAGAKLIGAINIGHHVKIGANAVVLSDVPSHTSAAGIPARIVKEHEHQLPNQPVPKSKS
jgi:serine O-acetyltransferase